MKCAGYVERIGDDKMAKRSDAPKNGGKREARKVAWGFTDKGNDNMFRDGKFITS